MRAADAAGFVPVPPQIVGASRQRWAGREGSRCRLDSSSGGGRRRTGAVVSSALGAGEGRNEDPDVVVIGAGLGGLCAAALLARYGKRVLVLESHYAAGGAAHGFELDGCHFDTGPSFFCGMTERGSLNPIKMVLDAVGESLPCVPYEDFFFHLPQGRLSVYGDLERYVDSVAQFSADGARQLRRFFDRMLRIYEALRRVPALALSANLAALPKLFANNARGFAALLPHVGVVQAPLSRVLDAEGVTDPFVRRLIDVECFLLSGLKADATITAEVAFMVGERQRRKLEYPVGGSAALVDALVRGLERHGGSLRLRSHVERIELSADGRAVRGVRLRDGSSVRCRTVVSNASVWDTVGRLLPAEAALPRSYREAQLRTPAVESFMHLHASFRAAEEDEERAERLRGHHVVVHDAARDIASPGNTCMISIPSVWDRSLAPDGQHVAHVYSVEPYDGWRRGREYRARKSERAAPLYRALRRVVPQLDGRLVLDRTGSPLTHELFLRRYKGTYGPAIRAGEASFAGPSTPLKGLYRVGDSVLPGIGVPAVAASGILCANSLVKYAQTEQLLRELGL